MGWIITCEVFKSGRTEFRIKKASGVWRFIHRITRKWSEVFVEYFKYERDAEAYFEYAMGA